MTGAAQRQLRPALRLCFLLVAFLAQAVHGFHIRWRKRVETCRSCAWGHIFMAFSTGQRTRLRVLALVALVAADIAAQGFLVAGVVEDRSRLIVIRMAFPTGCRLVARQVQVVAGLAGGRLSFCANEGKNRVMKDNSKSVFLFIILELRFEKKN